MSGECPCFEAFWLNLLSGQLRHTNTAYFVYVALDTNGRPTPVPPLQIETDAERAQWEAAQERQKERIRHRQVGP